MVNNDQNGHFEDSIGEKNHLMAKAKVVNADAGSDKWFAPIRKVEAPWIIDPSRFPWTNGSCEKCHEPTSFSKDSIKAVAVPKRRRDSPVIIPRAQVQPPSGV